MSNNYRNCHFSCSGSSLISNYVVNATSNTNLNAGRWITERKLSRPWSRFSINTLRCFVLSGAGAQVTNTREPTVLFHRCTFYTFTLKCWLVIIWPFTSLFHFVWLRSQSDKNDVSMWNSGKLWQPMVGWPRSYLSSRPTYWALRSPFCVPTPVRTACLLYTSLLVSIY